MTNLTEADLMEAAAISALLEEIRAEQGDDALEDASVCFGL